MADLMISQTPSRMMQHCTSRQAGDDRSPRQMAGDAFTPGIATLRSITDFRGPLGLTTAEQQEPQKKGELINGVILAGAGALGIALASFGVPGIGAIQPGLANSLVRFASVCAIDAGAVHMANDTDCSSAVRGVGLMGMGGTSLLAGLGKFGPIGGLTGICLCVGGVVGIFWGLDILSKGNR